MDNYKLQPHFLIRKVGLPPVAFCCFSSKTFGKGRGEWGGRMCFVFSEKRTNFYIGVRKEGRSYKGAFSVGVPNTSVMKIRMYAVENCFQVHGLGSLRLDTSILVTRRGMTSMFISISLSRHRIISS